jgi:hypothetical protein
LQGHPINKVSNIQFQKYHKKGMKFATDFQKHEDVLFFVFFENYIKHLSFSLLALE